MIKKRSHLCEILHPCLPSSNSNFLHYGAGIRIFIAEELGSIDEFRMIYAVQILGAILIALFFIRLVIVIATVIIIIIILLTLFHNTHNLHKFPSLFPDRTQQLFGFNFSFYSHKVFAHIRLHCYHSCTSKSFNQNFIFRFRSSDYTQY